MTFLTGFGDWTLKIGGNMKKKRDQKRLALNGTDQVSLLGNVKGNECIHLYDDALTCLFAHCLEVVMKDHWSGFRMKSTHVFIHEAPFVCFFFTFTINGQKRTN